MLFPARPHPQALRLGHVGPLLLRRELAVPVAQARSHWHCIGKTGSGKSRFLAGVVLELLRTGQPVTLLDPHGDTAQLVLSHLIAQGTYRDAAAFARIRYLDFPGAARQGFYFPFNPLVRRDAPHTLAADFTEALHRAFPELAEGAAIFDVLLPRSLRVLIHHGLPITELEPFLYEQAYRE